MALTDTKIRNAKPGAKSRKLADEHGLYLLLNPNRSRYWRFKYRYAGKEKLLSLGIYPATGLADARIKRDEARKLLAAEVDPSEHRKAAKAARVEASANSFEAVAREWFAKQERQWAPGHARTVIRRLESWLFPYLGRRPVEAITAAEVLRVLRRMESREVIESAHRCKQIAGQVFRYAVATGRAERDVTADLKGALTPVKVEHLAALTDPAKVGALLRAVWSYNGSPVVGAALRLHPYTFTRPGELRKAEWQEIDLDGATWELPAERMKTKQPHVVPLSTQAVGILRELEPLTGRGRYVFPSARGKGRPMSNMTENAALRRLGIGKDEFTAHGWRAVARTMLDEQLGFRLEFIEHQLAHRVRDPLGRAYNRTKHLKERQAMMQSWADYLDSLRTGANVIPLHGKRGTG